MYARDTNRKILAVLALCAGTAVGVAWTLREKFIDNGVIALAAGLLCAALIAALFTRYLEFRLNTAADSLITRIRRIAAGDLTQRFKEDSDDLLPYGLSLELDRMGGFLRENIGTLWKVSMRLSRQLNHLLESASALAVEFGAEVEHLSKLAADLETVRREITDITRTIADLRVNASNDSAFLKQVDGVTAAALDDLKAHRDTVRALSADLTALQNVTTDLKGVMAGFMDVSSKAAAIEMTVAELSMETGLVKLNASIDEVQAGGGANYGRLLEELKRIVDKLNALRQEGGSASGLAEGRIDGMAASLQTGEDRLRKGLTAVDAAGNAFARATAHYQDVAVSYDSIFENVKRLNTLMETVDSRTSGFQQSIKAAAGGFDKLRADAQITLLGFRELEKRAGAVRESLEALDGFKALFKIA